MPGLPWLTNVWGCSPWEAEPARDAVTDAGAFGVPTDPLASEGFTRAPLDPVDTPEEWYAIITQDWPVVPPLIDPNLRVSAKGDQTKIVEFMVNVRKKAENARIECFDRADYQLYLAGYKPTGRPTLDARSYLVMVEVMKDGSVQDQLDLPKMVQAVEYIKAALKEGVPVLVGLRLAHFDDRDMDDRDEATPEIYPTNHFVVIVGAGLSAEGRAYFSYLDSQSSFGDITRLYPLDTMFLNNPLGDTLTEVRTSIKR